MAKFLKFLAVAVAGGVLIFYAAMQMPVGDGDMWFHLPTGRLIVESGRVPKTDPFSWTAKGERWVDHSWGFDALLWEIYSHWGFLGVKILVALGAAAAGMIFAVLAYLASGSYFLSALAFLPPFFFREELFTPRPNLISLSLFAGVFLVLKLKAKYPKLLYGLPLLFLVWANLHSIFMLGLFLWGVHLFGEYRAGYRLNPAGLKKFIRGQRLEIGLLLTSAAVTLVNPNGYLTHIYAFFSGPSRDFHIFEWQSILFFLNTDLYQILFLFILGIVAIFIFNHWGRNLKTANFYVGAAFIALTLSAVRISSFLIVILIFVAASEIMLFSSKLADGKPEVPRFDFPVALALLIAVDIVVGLFLPRNPATVSYFGQPVSAARFIEQTQLPGRMYNDYNYGSYLLWRLPDHPVFIDSRFDPYVKNGVAADYLQIEAGGSNYRQLLETKYRVEYAVVLYSFKPYLYYQGSAGIATALLGDSEHYAAVYISDGSLIFVRRDSASAAYLARYELKYLPHVIFSRDLKVADLPAAKAEAERFLMVVPSAGVVRLALNQINQDLAAR